MSKGKHLSPEELGLVSTVLQEAGPEGASAMAALRAGKPLSTDQLELAQMLLCDELVENELDEHSEPTTRGKRLDDLIGRLGMVSVGQASKTGSS